MNSVCDPSLGLPIKIECQFFFFSLYLKEIIQKSSKYLVNK